MAYQLETLEAAILTKLKTITVANGYESAVGDNAFRFPTRPREDEIDPTKLPSLWLLCPEIMTMTEKGQVERGMVRWECHPHIFGVIASEATTPSGKWISLAMDTAKLVLANRAWSGTKAYETRIERIDKDPEFTRPYAAFTMELAVLFETTATSL